MPRPLPPLTDVLPLLRQAADRLAGAGQNLPTRIRTLRGLYYGTPHSLDFERRHSGMRNLGFNLYLHAWPPEDPSRLLGVNLIRSLKDAAEVTHAGRALDLGHVFVGLEARYRFSVRRLPLPAQGGTGLELATWLGDLGGAAGLLAIRRMDAPATRAVALLFSSDAYDLSANLEGDMAGYLVARHRDAGPRVTPPDGHVFATVPDALQDYASAKSAPSDWGQRHRLFAQMIGGVVGPDGLANRAALRDRIRAQTTAFAAFYIVYRLRQLGGLSRAALRAAGQHVAGASEELAGIFVDLLHRGILDPAAGPAGLYDPDPRPAGTPPRWLRMMSAGLGVAKG